jgi:hypothetical protein
LKIQQDFFILANFSVKQKKKAKGVGGTWYGVGPVQCSAPFAVSFTLSVRSSALSFISPIASFVVSFTLSVMSLVVSFTLFNVFLVLSSPY